MVASVKNIMKSLIANQMKSLGYKCKDNIYYRHINGVLLGFKIYSREMNYTIRFGCYPLCGGITRDPGSFENHEIGHILPNYREDFLYAVPWGELKTDEEMTTAWFHRKNKYPEIANQLVDELKNYLLPQLLEITSPEEALDFEKKCYISRIIHGHNMTTEEAEKIYNQNYTIYNWKWYLQMRNYSEAKQCLKKLIESIKEQSRQNDIVYDISFLEIPYNYLMSENYGEMEKYIATHENITLKSFALKC